MYASLQIIINCKGKHRHSFILKNKICLIHTKLEINFEKNRKDVNNTGKSVLGQHQ